MISQPVCIDGLDGHLLCPMQCCLIGVHISEVPKFLAKSPSVNTHATEFTDAFDATHPLIILLQLNGVMSYFDVYSLSVAEYENEDIPKIYLTTEKLQWGPSTNEYSERES